MNAACGRRLLRPDAAFTLLALALAIAGAVRYNRRANRSISTFRNQGDSFQSWREKKLHSSVPARSAAPSPSLPV
ncbi:MAG: hypothetical protein OEU92_00120, partial [Alphaproteobacteria bacterium]|nr:hypothetical protein [Alphaproteobacteria bacterium]